MNKIVKKQPKFLCLAVLLFGVNMVYAETDLYTNKTEFLALSGAKEYTTTYPQNLTNINQYESNLITFSTPAPSTLKFNEWTNQFPGPDLAIAGRENLDVTWGFKAHSIGFDVIEDSANSVFTIKLLHGDELVEQITLEMNSQTRFFGIWSDTGFNRMEIRETVGDNTEEYFGAFYGGIYANRDTSANTGALICQLPLLAAYSFSTGAAFTAPPPLDFGFDFAAHTANFGLKFCQAHALAPADKLTYTNDTSGTDPDSFDACHKSFDQERQHSHYTALFGIPIAYDYDWGELGTPQVMHQNTDVEVYLLKGQIPPMANNTTFAALINDEMASGGIHEGCDGIRGISLTGHDCPYAQNRKVNLAVGRNTLNYRFDVKVGALDLVYIPVPKFPKGAKNKELLDLGLNLLFEVTSTVVDVVFLDGWRFGNFVDRKQHVVVYDNTAPSISFVNDIDFNGDGVVNSADLQFIQNVVIEADEIGGVSASRYLQFLRSMYNTSDACDRQVTFGAEFPVDNLRVFWPVSQAGNDQSFDITWVAADPGPNTFGLPNETTITQNISVVDTKPPVIQPPMDIVELTDQTQVTLDLGQPLVFDLVDLNPVVENDVVFPLNAGLHTITWTATDASGNQSSTTQSVNIKNSNIEPNALALTGNNSQSAISFEPQEITLEGFDADGDPLNFFIEDYPENGFFVAPLYPYFIEDYRLEATMSDSEIEQVCIDNGPQDYNFHAQHIRNPEYFSVLDDGTTYVIDRGYVDCRVNQNSDPLYQPRIVLMDATGEFVVAQRRDIPDDFYININSEMIYITEGELNNGSVEVVNKNLEQVRRYNLFNLPNPEGEDFNIPNASSVTIDSQGVLYVLNERGDVFALHSDRGEGTNDNFRPELIGIVFDNPSSGDFNSDMAIDSEDNIYVSIKHRVYKFTAATVDDTGEFELGEMVGWLGKCLEDTAPGDQAVCDVANERSLGYSCFDDTCGGSFAQWGDQPGQFESARGITINRNDVLYVTDFFNSRIQRFTPDGFFAGQAESACDGSCFVLGDFGQPHDIAVNSSHFYIVDPTTNLLHISQTSPFLEVGDDYAKVLYQSNNDFACVLSADCVDSFSFSVSDGVRDSDSMQMVRSAPAVVAIEVERNFRAPFATPGMAFEAPEETATQFTLDGSDPDPLDTLSFNITRQPAYGVLSLSGDQVTYTSAINYVGQDSFEFTASDGNETSAPETVEVNVLDVNDPAVVDFNLPASVARGFEIRLDGTLIDPDIGDNHHLVVDWGDGTAQEPQGEVTMMGNITGPILYSNSLGNGTVFATHVFDAVGTYDTQFCVTDRVDEDGNATGDSIEQCSTANLSVTDMVDLTIEYTGPNALVRGQSDNYVVTVTNRVPDSGTGISATGVEFTATVDDVIISAQPAGCNSSGNVISCFIGHLAPGASTEITIPMIVPADTGEQVEILSELNVVANQDDLTEHNITLIRVPLLVDADVMIGGNTTAELADDVDVNLGNGVCLNSSGGCNLRAAIEEANNNMEINSISLGNAIFSLSLTTEVSPDSGYGDLDVLQDLEITGNGPEHTTIDAAGIDRVFDVGATLKLTNLSIVGGLTSNATEPNGAGIRVGSSGRLILENVTISNNDASASGGGIFVDSTATDSLVISNSTISANSANEGGGIFSFGGGSFDNVTISSNRVATIAGGIYLSGTNMFLRQVTVADNSANQAGGLFVSSGGTLTLANSILGENEAATGSDCQVTTGSILSAGGNLVSDTTGCTASWLNSDLINLSTNLFPLANNGGATQTHALKFTSAARDAGLTTHCGAADQRGEERPVDGDGDGVAACDSGAFEASGIEGDIVFQNSFE